MLMAGTLIGCFQSYRPLGGSQRLETLAKSEEEQIGTFDSQVDASIPKKAAAPLIRQYIRKEHSSQYEIQTQRIKLAVNGTMLMIYIETTVLWQNPEYGSECEPPLQ